MKGHGLCNLETGVRNSLCSSVRRGQRWRMCSCTAVGLWGGGGCITAFTVPDVTCLFGFHKSFVPC